MFLRSWNLMATSYSDNQISAVFICLDQHVKIRKKQKAELAVPSCN